MIPRIQLAEIAQRLTKSKLFVLTAPKGLNPMGIMAQILTEKGVVFDQLLTDPVIGVQVPAPAD